LHQRAFWWAIASGLSWIAFQVSLASPAGRAHTQAAPTASVVNVVRSFEGAAGPGYKDHPDAAGAVGPNHVVDFVGSGMVVRDKKTGAVIQQVSQTQFWQDAGVSPGDLNDPRLIYDPLSGRWFAVNAGPYAFLAVSADSDPTHPWKAVTLTTAVSGDVTPKPAADANGVYVCMYGGNFNTICVALPKSDLLWSGTNAPSLAHEAVFTDLPFEAMPAMDPNPEKAATAPELLLTRLGTQNEVGVPMILLLNKHPHAVHLHGTGECGAARRHSGEGPGRPPILESVRRGNQRVRPHRDRGGQPGRRRLVRGGRRYGPPGAERHAG